jgi:hypothetical protein
MEGSCCPYDHRIFDSQLVHEGRQDALRAAFVLAHVLEGLLFDPVDPVRGLWKFNQSDHRCCPPQTKEV